MLAAWLGTYEDGAETQVETDAVASAVHTSSPSEDTPASKKHPLQTLAHALAVATPPETHREQLLALEAAGGVPSVLETRACPETGVSLVSVDWEGLGVEDMIEMLTCMPTLGKTATTDDVLDWLLSFEPRSADQFVATDDAHSNSSLHLHATASTSTGLATDTMAFPAAHAASGEEECSMICRPPASETFSTVPGTPGVSEQSFTPRDYFEDQYTPRSSGPSSHGQFGCDDEDFNCFDAVPEEFNGFDAVPEWELEFFLRSALSDICQHLRLRRRTEAERLICEAQEQLRGWRQHD